MFAQIEMKTVIVNVISRLVIEQDQNDPPRIKHSCTTALQDGFRVKVHELLE